MEIGKVTCWLLRVPYRMPLGKDQLYKTLNFVEVETQDGLKGHALGGYSLSSAIREFINSECTTILKGMNPLRTEEIRTRMYWATAHKRFQGAWGCAMSLIDNALWDLKGKAFKQPIWMLLGGSFSQAPAYITFGFSHYSREELVEVAKMLVKEGQTRLKMVVGAGPNVYEDNRGPTNETYILEDINRVRAVREAVGPDVEIMIDGNKCASLPQALKLAKSCEQYGITWFEDAVLQGDPLLLAQLRAQTTIPLAAGSTATADLIYLRDYILHRSVDYLQPNVNDIGGYTQALKAAALAQSFNVPLAMGGSFPHSNMHLHGGVPNGGRVEFHLQAWKCAEAVFDGVPGPVNGKVTLPTGPGLGFAPRSGVLDLALK